MSSGPETWSRPRGTPPFASWLDDEDVRHVVIDDGRLNLLRESAIAALEQAFAVSPSTNVVTLRSGRARIFAAGADMKEMVGFSSRDAVRFSSSGQHLMEAIRSLPALTMVHIDGDCFGGALDLAMSFDLRWASDRSRFAHPGSRLGIVTGFGGTSRWRALVERPVAVRLFLENRILRGDEALDAGLIDGIVPGDDAFLAAAGAVGARCLSRILAVKEMLKEKAA